MLILTRRNGELIKIDLHEDVDPDMPVGKLFAHGPIEIAVKKIDKSQVKIGIQASGLFLILREELYAARQNKH